MPLPTTPFDGSEGLFYPHTQAIPLDICLFGLHISDDEPRLFVGFSPVCQKNTLDLLFLCLEESSIAIPECSRLLSEADKIPEVMPTSWTEHTQSASAHEGMPSLSSDSMEQTPGEKPPVSKNNDRHIIRDTWLERSEHIEPLFVPGTFSVALQDLPRYRNGASPVENTYCQNRESIRESSSIQSQSNLFSLPQAYDPFQDEGKAGFHMQLISLVAVLVLCIVTPLSQTLTKRVFFSHNGPAVFINT
jgi:hypothetical protein